MENDATGDQAAGAEGADLGSQVRSAIGRLYRRFRSERPEGGLGDAALAVLTRLHKSGPQTLTELSEHDRVSPASMSQTVNRLTSAGYAVRTRDPGDRRKVLFSATAEGDELASAARGNRPRHGTSQRHRRLMTGRLPSHIPWSTHYRGGR